MPGAKGTTVVALVTGAGSGIGRATAIQFAKSGCRVAVADVNQAAAEETCRMIKDAVPNAECLAIPCDISNPDQVQMMIQHVKDAFGRLDYAFNNAGIAGKAAAIHDLPLEEWDRVLSVNLRGHFVAMQHEIPLMLATSDKPAIVLTSSVAGHTVHPGMGAYAAAKFALRGLAQVAAVEYGPRGLRVNTVSPGAINTPMLRNFLGTGGATIRQLVQEGAKLSITDTATDNSKSTAKAEIPATADAPASADASETSPEAIAKFLDTSEAAQAVPLRRNGKPSDIADAVVWLCMHGDYVTGTDLVVDGGWTARLAG